MTRLLNAQVPEGVPGCHQYVLDKLLESSTGTKPVFFCVRKNNSDRFKAGYWFQGTSEYLFCAPFKFNEQNNKTKTIGLVVGFKNEKIVSVNYQIVFGAPSCQAHLPLYKDVLAVLGATYENGKSDYRIQLETGHDLDAALDHLTTTLIPKVTAIIQRHQLESDYLLTQQEFDNSLAKIIARKAEGLVPLPDTKPDNAAPQFADEDSAVVESQGIHGRNVIYYGPPGTGKTRTLLQQVLPQYTNDFGAASGETVVDRVGPLSWFEVVGAVLAEHPNSALRVPDISKHPFVQAKLLAGASSRNHTQAIWNTLQNHTAIESTTVRTDVAKRRSPLVFDKTEASQWHLVPEWQEIAPELNTTLSALRAGAEEVTATHRYEMVTFHPSYSYEDFVEGLRPVEVESEDDSTSFEIMPVDGVFKRLCDRARRDPAHRYAVVIDEVNRGNIAKIFGELITLIEQDKRLRIDEQGNVVGGVEVRLPYTGHLFGVPENVDLYGTMNTSDRSIALVDIALRRRFTFTHLPPDPSAIPGATNQPEGCIDGEDGNPIDLRCMLRVINARLTVLRGRDACIGHGYLTNVRDLGGLQRAFTDGIIPLLQEHFFEDWTGIAQVLSVPNGVQPLVSAFKPKIASLFFSEAGQLDDFEDRPLHRVTASISAASFRAIYASVPAAALNDF
ncbi:McrB family protein [Paraburkholderia sp. RL17-381-BIF-C]|uniref:McrB family protein n=1 Tax=Paraburkholderia sp. RL17-381-BIF-C TaxID=3031635 RepID=UPI0038BCE65D